MSLWQEYALEPTLFDDYSQARLLLSGFGVDRGRLIGAFPRKWQREVKRRLFGYTDMQRKTLIDKLDRLDPILVPRTHPYDGNVPWRRQAFECDRTDPFHAILTDGVDAHPKSIDGSGDLDASPLWAITGQTSIPRNANALARTLEFILKRCHEVLIVDREFIPSGGTGKKWLNPLASIATTLVPQGRVARFELHTLDKPIAPWPTGKFVRDCSHHLPPCIPKALSLSANLWRQRQGGLQFHERLIITDIGGVLLDPGFDEGKPGETYDIRLLHNSECTQYLKRFDKLSLAYDLVDNIEVRGQI
jgi:hypothetical protein